MPLYLWSLLTCPPPPILPPIGFTLCVPPFCFAVGLESTGGSFSSVLPYGTIELQPRSQMRGGAEKRETCPKQIGFKMLENIPRKKEKRLRPILWIVYEIFCAKYPYLMTEEEHVFFIFLTAVRNLWQVVIQQEQTKVDGVIGST